MKIKSFRSIILFTIFLVVGTISFFAISLYNNFLSKEIYKHVENDIISVLSLLQNNYIHTVAQNGGQILHPLLENLKDNSHVRHAYLFNSQDSLIFSPGHDSLTISGYRYDKQNDFKDDIGVHIYNDESIPYLRAYIRLQNSPKCYECHHSTEKYLGTLVFDISLAETRKNIALTRNFSLVYSGSIVLFILISIFTVHYRYVKKSLSKFHESINNVNKGDLNERISIADSKELGKLGKSFNVMLQTFQDTQQKLQSYHQKELEDKYKLATVGEMTARLAHEIRNPITGIASAIEILVEQMPEDEHKFVLEEIQRQTKRVNNSISNMLRFSRSTDINIGISDINKTIKAIVFFIKNQSHHKKIKFRQELDENIAPFQFDHEQIENVLLNLVLNAIQAIRHAGSITLKTGFDSENKNVIIIIEDTGDGIAPNHLNDIFNPFFTTRTEGTGLGLAISKEIIEKHNGRIWVESEETIGSNFYISLPVI